MEITKPPEAEEDLVMDSSVDHKGRLPRRASTGCWKASLFIIAIEFAERLSYFGLATNLIIYLTQVLHQDLKTAVRNVNYWSGVTAVIPLLGGFIADAYSGRYATVVVSSLIYIVGLLLLTMSQLIPGLKPCDEDEPDSATCRRSLSAHAIAFFVAMYLISFGTGGHKPALESFGADQFDDNHEAERRKKMSYFNWWNFGLCSGMILGVTVVVYLAVNVGWWIGNALLTCIMAVSLVIFIAGRPVYRYRAPEGSPFTPMLRAAVAAVAKRRMTLPSDASELYELRKTEQKKRLLYHTDRLKFLDKAAIIEHKGDEAAFAAEKYNPWRLATVTQVEELKLVLSMIPVWITAMPFGMCVAQTNTFFIKQCSVTDRRFGHFTIPAASVFCLSAIGMLLTVTFYDKILIPLLRRSTGSVRGISILKRIGIGITIVAAGIATAALVERRRLLEAAQGRNVSLLWLVPQFFILGIGDGFALVGLQEYFYEQVPDGMRSLGIAFYLSVLGIPNFICSLLITIVDRITSKGSNGSWFAKDVNDSRLDLYYWLLTAISAVNLCAYVYIAKGYSYKRVQRKVANDMIL
ncbi:protein NRT1/ PTR FAMILY 5.6-like [Curcuma longa]|uniref:protein NRT1/ PTR FAMILY 5.6-like n=1 Tax=Curcuma longa TaxID=136217 RepID=UPI003D9DD8B9